MFCSRCGKQVDESNRFCQTCGQEIGTVVSTAPSATGALPPPIATSAQVSPPLMYAGFWERVAAYLIDGLIIGIPAGIVLLALIFMFGGFGVMLHRHSRVGSPDAAGLVAPIFFIFLSAMFFFVILRWLYFAGMESSARQATYGKSAMSLRVTNLDGQRISFGHATGRFFAKIVSGMIPFAIGFLMAAFTERKQALHDLIAGTLVLKN